MDAYLLSKYQDDEIISFFIEYSLDKEGFISKIDKDFLVKPGEIDELWKLKATFPYNIVVEDDPAESKRLMERRKDILSREHKDPVIINTKIQLLGTIYPNQINDFFILEIPLFMKNAGQHVPVDWELKELVLYLWKNGFPADGWDASQQDNSAFITVSFVEFCDFNEEEPFTKKMKEFYDKLQRFQGNYEFIDMKYTDLQKIHKYYSLKFPDHSKALKGGLIPFWKNPI